MMDFLQCSICRFFFDEESHQPRLAPCSHEFCRACIKALIKKGLFMCPQCCRKHEVNLPEDFPMSNGLIGAIKAFRPMNLDSQLQAHSQPNDSDCKIHQKVITHRCTKCRIWACVDCIEGHSTLTGCSLIKCSEALDNIKKEHNDKVDQLLDMFEGDISHVTLIIEGYNGKIKEINEQRKKLLEESDSHREEIKKMQKQIEDGYNRKEDVIKSKADFNSTHAPHALMEKAEALIHSRQLLHIWSVENFGADTAYRLQKVIKEGKEVYTELDMKGDKWHAKLSHQEGQILFHTFWSQPKRDHGITISYTNVQKFLPTEPTKVFIELSVGSTIRGKITIKLEDDMPNMIRENLVKLLTGVTGKTLRGGELSNYTSQYVYANNFQFNDSTINHTWGSGSVLGKQGAVYCYYPNNYLTYLYIVVADPPAMQSFSSYGTVIGHIVDNMDLVLDFSRSLTKGVFISDCGLIIEDQL